MEYQIGSIMKKGTVLRRISSLKGELMEYGVANIGLFGSTVRGENRTNSDIDILIDFHVGKETYSNFMMVCDILQNAFSRHKLDIVTLNGLSPYIGKNILKEIEYA